MRMDTSNPRFLGSKLDKSLTLFLMTLYGPPLTSRTTNRYVWTCPQLLNRRFMLSQSKEVYDLLSLHYVEDDNASFRFQYTAEFLKWWAHYPIVLDNDGLSV